MSNQIKPDMKLNPDLTFNIPFVPDVKVSYCTAASYVM